MTYTKYSASGNDFVIFHSFIKKDYSKEAIALCNRTEGIGADGLIVLIPNSDYDFEWLFYNSDGSHAAMCGNGTRACAHYAYTNNLASSNMKFLTGAGAIESIVEDDVVQTQLTKPILIKDEFSQDGFTWYLVDTGVPHLVSIVDDLEKYDNNLASKMRYEYNANVNFAKIEDGKIYVRTYERGVEGETLACGTGMAACFLRANNLGLVEDIANVYPKSKEELTLTKKDEKLYFKGAVKKVFTTSIN
ncbi:diaminopimelate epimerase [Malaciobacter marinus]|uniref:Diaminopimelate epimerase n=1 Tax=Malaciobacter marinus TaxID=505249 RepID=A0A347TH61_9BACT|nr:MULTISPECIES: diaminopimelate epimerase [Malaciobacter]AXX85939.1 diaminopimelate epimerase [Malaciobacter marinus]PHO11862.1 diaminopimelate epimerase [Malaciobacter marinus]PHO15374.1 diaminopimelate epimerase [Malaciobacter marinus]RYA22728.1 diaminopimelate epimerase [Malaciobacter halophilus]